MLRREEINEDILTEVIELFIQAGIENEQITDAFKEKLKVFLVKETRWLTVEAIVNVVKNFSKNERQELFEKAMRHL